MHEVPGFVGAGFVLKLSSDSFYVEPFNSETLEFIGAYCNSVYLHRISSVSASSVLYDTYHMFFCPGRGITALWLFVMILSFIFPRLWARYR